MTPREKSEKLNVNYREILEIISQKVLKAEKQKNRWIIQEKDFQNFKKKNSGKIEDLKKRYVSLYWQGLTINSLKNRTKEDFEKEKIYLIPYKDFAEQTIYNHLMEGKKR